MENWYFDNTKQTYYPNHAYKRDTLENFYAWQGTNGSPAIGTVNYIMGFNTNNPKTYRYSKPIIHKDSTCQCDSYDMPIIGTISGVETDVYWIVESDCPSEKIPTGLITVEDFNALGWIEEENI
jgi:hypothetical protein